MLRHPSFRPITSSLTRQCVRCLHHRMPEPVIPPPIPFVPDVKTFLTAIGRGLSKHTSKFSSWDQLFSMSSAQMREAGLEPARNRRYLLHWREKFRNGEYGVGGDFTEVADGVAEVRIVEVPIPEKEGRGASAMQSAGIKKTVVNVPIGATPIRMDAKDVKKPAFIKIRGPDLISGPHCEPVKGTRGLTYRIRMKEGIWEEKRGVKKDGGERRRAEVRAKRRAAERKAAE